MLFKTLIAALMAVAVIAVPTKTDAKRESDSVDFYIHTPGTIHTGAPDVEKRDEFTWPPPPICTPHPCTEGLNE
ncbi:hypothetical protein UA08_03112 [Talaromyces atroroseus]|uniref:Uncharacterized protein n=1 Tax=Talaromyces atroroseus TaxID=1441469 RepID=A0A225AIG4_TALAT|nr:hypothetical protein UA08_03112 [Talaromyces atroroseus]OKL61242.1 hypothetical protein UA08_03112 [Talaromyces atroroseus]